MNENKTNYDKETREVRIFFIITAVFIVACVIICYVCDYLDRAQYVEITPIATSAVSDVIPESEKININTASKEELMTLKGIGSVTADNIIYYREHNNGFLDTDELIEVDGIGKKTLEKLRPYITA